MFCDLLLVKCTQSQLPPLGLIIAGIIILEIINYYNKFIIINKLLL